LERRRLIGNGLKISAGLALAPAARALNMAAPKIILRASGAEPFRLPEDFTGLGYEMSSVAPIGLLSASNDRYVQLVKQLGSQGVLRVGGIVADFTRFEADGKPKADMHDTVITREALEQFSGFLKKTNWTAIWSVNFAHGSIRDAVMEAKAVASVLGPNLLALEIGNEVENYGRGAKPIRKPPYSYEAYRVEYTAWRAAIVRELPDARFAAPDTAASVEWVERMAQDAHGDVQLLTTHYYRSQQKKGSAEELQYGDPKLLDRLTRLRTASEHSQIPWRMCETNSFSGGGLPGVSDTLLGALWTLDFMLLLAKYGCAGVNLETGVNQLGFVSSYSPIQDDGKAHNTAGVPYYGMLAFAVARAGCTHSIALDAPEGADGLTAYALGSGSEAKSLVLVNRGSRAAEVQVGPTGFSQGSVLRLSGASADSKLGLTLGGAAVGPDGHWNAPSAERVAGSSVVVPGMSAAVVLRQG
jgi:hypothetical protein